MINTLVQVESFEQRSTCTILLMVSTLSYCEKAVCFLRKGLWVSVRLCFGCLLGDAQYIAWEPMSCTSSVSMGEPVKGLMWTGLASVCACGLACLGILLCPGKWFGVTTLSISICIENCFV